MPVACSFAPGRGEIQTSRQAGGIASASIRSSFAGSVIRLPRASRYRNAPFDPFGASPSVAPFEPFPHRPRRSRRMPTIVVLEGDETGQELLEEALRVLDPDVIGLDARFAALRPLARARAARPTTGRATRLPPDPRDGLGLKAATVTPEGAGDVGSPNRILREEIGGRVIVRTGRRIPGVVPLGGVHAPISVVRMAVGDAYGAKEWREGEGDDEVAFRTERIERRICRVVAEFAFRQAERTRRQGFRRTRSTPSARSTRACSRKRWTRRPSATRRVPYEPQLIDATFALLLASTGEPLVIPR